MTLIQSLFNIYIYIYIYIYIRGSFNEFTTTSQGQKDSGRNGNN